jgi:uncharacterized protein
MNRLQSAVLSTLLATTALAMPAVSHVAAQETANSAYLQSVTVVNLQGEARRKVAADRVSAELSADERSATSTEAQKLVNTKAQLVKAAVGKVPGVRLTTSSYNVYRTSDGWTYDANGKRVKSGDEEWSARQQFTLDSSDPVAVQKVVGELQAKGLQLQGTNFYLSREAMDKLQQELVSEAIASVKTRASALSRDLGMPTVRIARIDVNGGGYQPPMPYVRAMAMKADGAAESMPAPVAEPGDIEINVNVGAEVHLK